MVEGKDSALIRLVRGEGGALWLSQPERRLIKFAIDTFGEPLSRFLLSGLGEEREEGRIWLFTIAFTAHHGVNMNREVKVEADDLPDIVTSLPQRREPLVILALLWLLLAGSGSSSSSLSYQQEEVLGLLGWQNDTQSRLAIDEAVNRYVDLSYRWTLSGDELAEKNYPHYRGWARFVSGCGYRDIEQGESGRMRRVANRVEFASEFVSDLMSRSLFGVYWNKVVSLERSSQP